MKCSVFVKKFDMEKLAEQKIKQQQKFLKLIILPEFLFITSKVSMICTLCLLHHFKRQKTRVIKYEELR